VSNPKQTQTIEELNPNMSPEQIRRNLMIQLSQMSKQLKIDSEDLRLSKHEHDKLSNLVTAYDQTVSDYMQSVEGVESKLQMKIKELQSEIVNLRKGIKPK